MLPPKYREHPMKLLRVAAVMALMIGPAYAQMPAMNLLQDGPGKTQDEIDAQQAREKAYQDTLKKIPDAKVSNDPWGTVRSSDATKTSADKTSKAPAAKTAAAAKAKVKTGSNAN
jgi:hypothetical protein